MSYTYTIIDAFAPKPFAGNPAAVFVLEAPRSEEWMRHVAREMNLSETAFLHPEGDGFRLRWFTPTVEMALCGHATLASAHILYETGQLARDQAASFYTMSGELGASSEGEWIALDFPLRRPTRVDVSQPLAAALDIMPLEVWQHGEDLLALLPSSKDVRSLAPDIAGIKALSVHGVIVTAASDEAGIDFVSRYFAPSIGVNEDPVTGSAHCVLAPFWADRLGKSEMTGFQASARGGIVRVQPQGDRVRLLGQSITIARCEMLAE